MNTTFDPRKIYPIQGNIAICPIEFLPFFKANPIDASMEYLSRPTGSISPFFSDFSKVSSAVRMDVPNPLNWETYTLDVDFQAGQDRRPRFMHIDLAENNDGAGIAMCHADGFKPVFMRGEDGGFGEVYVPLIKWDFMGVLRPRKSYQEREINYDALMMMVFELRNRGFNFDGGLVTFDRFQSHQFKGTMFSAGFNVSLLSIDHTTSKVILDFEKEDRIRKEPIQRQPAAAMLSLRDALYQDRAFFPNLPEHPDVPDMSWIEKEAYESQSNYDNVNRLLKVVKVDGGSDDLIQAAAGSCFNCVNNVIYGSDSETKTDPWIEQKEQSFYDQFGRRNSDMPMGDGILIGDEDITGRSLDANPVGVDPFYVRMERDRLDLY